METEGKFFLSAKGKAVICIYYSSWHKFSVFSWFGFTLLKFGQELNEQMGMRIRTGLRSA